LALGAKQTAQSAGVDVPRTQLKHAERYIELPTAQLCRGAGPILAAAQSTYDQAQTSDPGVGRRPTSKKSKANAQLGQAESGAL